jgi:hypothetical protein
MLPPGIANERLAAAVCSSARNLLLRDEPFFDRCKSKPSSLLPSYYLTTATSRSLTLQKGFSSAESIIAHALPIFNLLSKAADIEDLRGVGLHLTKLSGSSKENKDSPGQRGKTVGIMDCFKATVPIPAVVPAPLPCADIVPSLRTDYPDKTSNDVAIARVFSAPVSGINHSAIVSHSTSGSSKSESRVQIRKRPAEYPKTRSHDGSGSFTGNMDKDEASSYDAIRRPSRDLDLTEISDSPLRDSYHCLPNASQLDLAVLRELPEDMQAELMGAMERKAARNFNGGSSSSSRHSSSSSSSSSSSTSSSSLPTSSSSLPSSSYPLPSSSSSSSSSASSSSSSMSLRKAVIAPTSSSLSRTDQEELVAECSIIPAQVGVVPSDGHSSKRRRVIVGCSCKGRDCIYHPDYDGGLRSKPPPPRRSKSSDFIDMTEDPLDGEEDVSTVPLLEAISPPVETLNHATSNTAEKRKLFLDEFLKNIPEGMREEVMAQMQKEAESVTKRPEASAPRKIDSVEDEAPMIKKDARNNAHGKKSIGSKDKKQQVHTISTLSCSASIQGSKHLNILVFGPLTISLPSFFSTVGYSNELQSPVPRPRNPV